MVDPISEATRATQADGEEWKPTKEFGFKSGDRPLEGYTIKRGLGRGGFGEVYYAISDGGKEVALKLIQRHLDVELRGVAQCLNLKNSNLVTVYDVRYNDRGENWVVMEYMAGPSLQERLQKSEGAFPIDEAFHWLTGISAAIDYLHQNGIVHRDLKPGNVFGEGDLVKLGDYGLSKFISASR
ncbi:MAG TPA: protein kinase, partial [Planctomycetia bacterium]|nr:protein kinase [Planctomycetia bacterium]